jgi:hypothetical protein
MDNIDLEYVQNSNMFDLTSSNYEEESNPLYSDNNHLCKYYQESECLAKFSKIKNTTFSTISPNIRSLPNKFNELKDLLHSSFGNFLPDVIALQEVWNIPLLDKFPLDGYHPIQFKIRDDSGLKSNIG